MSTVTPDAIFGADQDTINIVLGGLYDALKSAGFWKLAVDVNEGGISILTADFKQAFQVDLNTPGHFLEAVKTLAAADTALVKHTDAIVDAATNVSFTLLAPSVDIIFTYTNKQKQELPNSKLSVGAVIFVDPVHKSYRVQAKTGRINSGNPELDSLLNNSAIPALLKELNQKILISMSIPCIQVPGANLGVPVPVCQAGYVVGYAAADAKIPTIPPPYTGWPHRNIFLGIDSALIQRVAESSIPQPDSGTFGWAIFSGSYGAHLGPLSNVAIGAGGAITADIHATGYFKITADLGWLLGKHSWSPNGHGVVKVGLKPSVSNGKLVLTFQGASLPHFDLDIVGGLPGPIAWAINKWLGGLADLLIGLISTPIIAILNGHSFSVFDIPAIDINIGKGIQINFNQLVTSSVSPQAGQTLLVASGMPSITSK